MRSAYALLGFVWLLVFAALAWSFHPQDKSVDTISNTAMATSTLTLTSSAFENGAFIPSRYTCDEERDLNPPLSIAGVPEGARSLALIMDDPDVPRALKPDGMFDHWVLFNIPPKTREIPESASTGVAGVNGAGKNAYTGPCPPTQYEPSQHRYFFKLYALDVMLGLPEGSSKADVEQAMAGHIMAQAELLGLYKKK